MRYSLAFKEKVVKRILPPNDESVRVVAKEIGVSENSIYIWIKKLKEGTLGKDGDVYPSKRQPKEKLRLLLEGKNIPDENQGEWLRKNGLHSEHLHQAFEQELREIVEDKSEKQKEEKRQLKSEVKDLKKELRRKEKALAEMAALLTLKKKRAKSGGTTRTIDTTR